MYQIYLAGGMTGLSNEEQKVWRKEVQAAINKVVVPGEVEFFDPTEYDTSDILDKNSAEELSMKLDVRHLINSDLVICNISTNPLSVGTNIELGICHNTQIPVITYNPDKAPMHPWQESISDYVAYNMNKLIQIIRDYYLPRRALR